MSDAVLSLLGRAGALRVSADPAARGALDAVGAATGSAPLELASCIQTHHAHNYNGTDSNTFFWRAVFEGTSGAGKGAWKLDTGTVYCHADSEPASCEAVLSIGTGSSELVQWGSRNWKLQGWPPGPDAYPEAEEGEEKPSHAAEWTIASAKPEGEVLEALSAAVDTLIKLATRRPGGCCDALFTEDSGMDGEPPMPVAGVEKLLSGSPSAEDIKAADSALRCHLAGPDTVWAHFESPVPLLASSATSYPENLWSAGPQRSLQWGRVTKIGDIVAKGFVDGAEDGQGVTVRLGVLARGADGEVKGLLSLEKDVEPAEDGGFEVDIKEDAKQALESAGGWTAVVEKLGVPGLVVAGDSAKWSLPGGV
ncbi:hypothetical protein DFJ74DRAFT_679696 [Hyaloraphidium curvatum]|nr:hypothetical protein DFJ74DRAFT_679696 [Hyaloraphidium curvatum]